MGTGYQPDAVRLLQRMLDQARSDLPEARKTDAIFDDRVTKIMGAAFDGFEGASYVDGPGLQELFRGLAVVASVMCPAFRCGHLNAGPDGFRRSRPYQLVGIGTL